MFYEGSVLVGSIGPNRINGLGLDKYY